VDLALDQLSIKYQHVMEFTSMLSQIYTYQIMETIASLSGMLEIEQVAEWFVYQHADDHILAFFLL
jgi:hypothetical protein